MVQSNPILLTPGLLVHRFLVTNPWSPLGNLQWFWDPVPPNHVLNTMLAPRYISLVQSLRQGGQLLHGGPRASAQLVPSQRSTLSVLDKPLIATPHTIKCAEPNHMAIISSSVLAVLNNTKSLARCERSSAEIEARQP